MRSTWGLPGRVLVGSTALVALVAGCGDDDDSSGDVEAYCAAVAEIDSSRDVPTVEQMEAIKDVAPDEISDDIDFVADAFIEGIENGNLEEVFEDEEVGARLENSIEPFEQENCPDNEE